MVNSLSSIKNQCLFFNLYFLDIFTQFISFLLFTFNRCDSIDFSQFSIFWLCCHNFPMFFMLVQPSWKMQTFCLFCDMHFSYACKFSNVFRRKANIHEMKKNLQQTWSSWVEFKFLSHRLVFVFISTGFWMSQTFFLSLKKYFSSQTLLFCLFHPFLFVGTTFN